MTQPWKAKNIKKTTNMEQNKERKCKVFVWLHAGGGGWSSKFYVGEKKKSESLSVM